MKLLDRALSLVGLQARPVEARSDVKDMGSLRDPVLVEWGGGGQTTAGIVVTPNNARECAEVDACVGLIEDTIATVPLDLFERTGDGSRERRDDHPLHALLHHQPNAWQTSAEFRQTVEGYRNTHGNGYARVVSTLKGPSALEPIHPDHCRPFRVAGGVAYRWQPEGVGAERILLQHEVLHLRGGPPKRSNPFEAESKIDRHRDTFALILACEQYLSRFFSGNATPKSAITLPSAISDEAAVKLRASWERRHGGLENAHRIAVLDGGMDIKALGFNNDEAQVVQTHQMAVAKAARILGVPPHMIGETANVTNWGTGIEQQSIGFVTYYMRPKFVIWEQALNMTLMSSDMRRKFFFEFNIDGLLRGDFKTRMEGYALMIQWGLATVNEIRRLMNLPPVDGGGERLHPLNMAPASRIMDVLLRTSNGTTAGQRDAADIATALIAQLANASSLRTEPANGN